MKLLPTGVALNTSVVHDTGNFWYQQWYQHNY